jgi:hypothetical protein
LLVSLPGETPLAISDAEKNFGLFNEGMVLQKE